jgi:hypothetical protein
MAYELKRIVAAHGDKFWRNEMLRGIAAAPVYVFTDQAAFDSDNIERAAMRRMFEPLRLPHDEIIFEVWDQTGERESHLVYARQCGEHIEGVYLYKIGLGKGWTDVLADLTLHQGGTAEVETHPSAGSEALQIYPVVASGIVWRALAILSAEHAVERQSIPQTRRPKLARAGVTGWDWNLVSFDPAELKPKSPPLGGTHATPRWHIRRGHWRTLADGRRVFVRECEVGDRSRGGVVKDYEVAA